MKNLSCVFLALLLSLSHLIYAQDTPPPAPNFEMILAGSYIIPLDLEKQSTTYQYETYYGTPIIFNTINLAAYGLANELLSQGIEIKWVIKAGKSMGDADFTAEVERVFPSTIGAQVESFYTSAFIIGPEPEACNPNLPGGTFSIDNIIEEFGNDVAVYKLMDDNDLDVRYTITAPPRITILNDSNLEEVFTAILDTARIDNYSVQSNAQFLGTPECNTIVCQPHIDSYLVDQDYVTVVEDFVLAGGNFFAQCVGVHSFEEEGFFQTTNGIDIFSFSTGTNFQYHNPDMPVMQFEGDIPFELSGSMGAFELSAGSTFEPYAYTQITSGSGSNEAYVSTAADLNGAAIGGNMIYLGAHSYSFAFLLDYVNPADPAELFQSERLFLNSVFIPSNINYACAGYDVCICPGDSIQLGCPDLSEELDFVWSPSDGLSCTECPRPMAAPSETTTYTMNTVSGDCGFSEVTVSILEAPNYDSINYECDDQDQSYSVSFNLNYSSNVYLVSGTSGVLTGNTFVSDAIPTGQAFAMTFSDDGGCELIVDGIYSCDCNVTASMSGGGSLCAESDEPVLLSVDLTGDGPWELEYSIDGISQAPVIANSSPYIISVSEVGLLNLISVYDSFCPGNVSGSVEVTELSSADATIEPISDVLCTNDNAIEIFTLQNTGTLSGLGVIENTFDPLIAGPGIHSISYTIDDPCGDIQSIYIEVVGAPDLELLISPAECLGDTAIITALYSGGTLDWNIPEFADQILTTAGGTYTATVTNDYCSKEASLTFDIEECIEPCILIGPNAFTPDENGVNDTFKPDTNCIFDEYIFRVYNRWGERLFETTDQDAAWDGTYKGENLNNGVFVWTAKGWAIDGGERSKKTAKGNVTLIR